MKYLGVLEENYIFTPVLSHIICFGKGFNNGSQSHLQYLPEPQTDFVFATMAEEWGLIGGLFVIGIFAIGGIDDAAE